MDFSAIPVGEAVFVDANVLVYAFSSEPSFEAPSVRLLERIEAGEIQGFISATSLSEVAHRLMTFEACDTLGWPYPGINRRLRRHPDELRKLARYKEALTEIVATGITVFPIERDDVLAAAEISRQHGLLSGDALMVAIMQAHRLTNLASNDADFDRVPGITRFAPA
jgi:predicted nucleic acid-binding protein